MQIIRAVLFSLFSSKTSIGRAQRIGFVVLATAAAGLGWRDTAAAQEFSPASQNKRETGLSLPGFSRCMPASPPVLPERWHAVALMAPFEEAQLDVGEFVYDAALPAMRATVTGVESG